MSERVVKQLLFAAAQLIKANEGPILKWDRWREYIAKGGKESWPTEEFQELLYGISTVYLSMAKYINAMEEEVRASRLLTSDAFRLNWLEKHPELFVLYDRLADNLPAWQVCEHKNGALLGQGETLRGAIEEAMRNKP